MRHRKAGKTLDRAKAPRTALLRNLVTSIVLYEKVTTTAGKAKAVKPLVEKMITLGKVNSVLNRRRLLEVLYDAKAVDKVLEVLGPRFKDTKGGYTRITTLGRRKGDAATMALIEFVN